ncbi:uncharacterized protein N7503_007765 [Penicillium pulvis]|uniref:uncharacterized protein n=1 Tax=Penicillium pulvis TaxID=1562058 RepID=UPI002546BDE5|nr:uncharacterized protein N7503_007765 [Penicillium pulvis]KAJ5798469.1 hypothetical protein N7503_007765 [Penicillium pulvis]
MKCTFEWRVTENDSSSAFMEAVSEELSVLLNVNDTHHSDTTEHTAPGNSSENYTPDENNPETPAPENSHPDNRAEQNGTADTDIPRIDNPKAKDPNINVSYSITPENDIPDDKTSEITAPVTGDQESHPPGNSAPEYSTPGIEVPEARSPNHSVPDNTSPVINTTDKTASTSNGLTIELVVQEPDLTPTMATFEAPYDSPPPSPTSTASSGSNSDPIASNASINAIPAPPSPNPRDPTLPSTTPQSDASSFSDSEDLRSPAPEPTAERKEIPAEEGILETTPATTEQDLIASLHLIADSIAQQRQIAAKSILHSGFYWSILVIVFEYLYRVLWHTSADWIMILLLWICFAIATLSGIKMWTGGYLDEAERVGRWSWLFGSKWASNFDGGLRADNDDGWSPLRWTLCQGVWFRVSGGHAEKALAWCALKRDGKKKDVLRQSLGGVCDMGKAWEEYSAGASADASAGLEIDVQKESLDEGWMQDKVFVSRFNGRVIATLVIRIMPVDTDSVVTVSRNEYDSEPDVDSDEYCHPAHLEPVLRPEKVVIRAWTVLQKYRGNGVGLGILQFAIEYARELELQGPEFAVDHANSLRALPKFFSGGMDRDDKRARDRLAKEIRKFVGGEGNGKKG